MSSLLSTNPLDYRSDSELGRGDYSNSLESDALVSRVRIACLGDDGTREPWFVALQAAKLQLLAKGRNGVVSRSGSHRAGDENRVRKRPI